METRNPTRTDLSLPGNVAMMLLHTMAQMAQPEGRTMGIVHFFRSPSSLSSAHFLVQTCMHMFIPGGPGKDSRWVKFATSLKQAFGDSVCPPLGPLSLLAQELHWQSPIMIVFMVGHETLTLTRIPVTVLRPTYDGHCSHLEP